MRLPSSRAGVGLALVAALCFAGFDTSVRQVTTVVPVLAMLLFRYGLQSALMGVYLAFSRRHGFASARPGFQVLRGGLLLSCTALAFFGLRYMPVPEYTAVIMLTPVIATLMAATLLGERVTPLRWALVAGSLIGALLIVRPGSGLFGWAVIFPLLGAIAYAAFQTLTGHLAAHEDPFTTHFWTGAVGVAMLLPLAALQWSFDRPDLVGTITALPAGTWGWIWGVGLFSMVGHLMLVLAFRRTPASIVSPLLYTQIAFALLLAWWVFGHLPDAWAWAGIAIVSACSAATAMFNVRRPANDETTRPALAAAD